MKGKSKQLYYLYYRPGNTGGHKGHEDQLGIQQCSFSSKYFLTKGPGAILFTWATKEGDAFTKRSLQNEGLKSYESSVPKSISVLLNSVTHLAKIANKMAIQKTPKFCTEAAGFLVLLTLNSFRQKVISVSTPIWQLSNSSGSRFSAVCTTFVGSEKYQITVIKVF